MYAYTPDAEAGRWETMATTGVVHPDAYEPAFAALDSKIFIFGGYVGKSQMTDALSTLSADGRFERLVPDGQVPSSRAKHQGFAYKNKFYFGGGKELRSDGGYELTNDFYKYDPRLNLFTRLSIRGKRMKPRRDFAIALLGDRVFIHCGWTSTEV